MYLLMNLMYGYIEEGVTACSRNTPITAIPCPLASTAKLSCPSSSEAVDYDGIIPRFDLLFMKSLRLHTRLMEGVGWRGDLAHET